jgi:uncharacterized membrane protein YgaE (UPF0421/DUF939 family)
MESVQRKQEGVFETEGSRVGLAVAFATVMGIACIVSYWLITNILALEYHVSRDDDMLGGMWAVVATIFVFRHSVRESSRAAFSRTLATLISFGLCFLYFLVLPFNVFGMIAAIWIGTVTLVLMGRSDEIVTTGITTAVVFVVAGLSPGPTWLQPIFRLVDTAVGTTVGILAWRLIPILGLSEGSPLIEG